MPWSKPTLLPTLEITLIAKGIAADPTGRSSTTIVAVAPRPVRRKRRPSTHVPVGSGSSDSTTVWSPNAL